MSHNQPMTMKRLLVSFLTTLLALALPPTVSSQSMKWVSVQEIYAKGKHNAWPDLCRWRDQYYVVFAGHGEGHAEPHGVVMLSSPDGEHWETVFDEPQQHWKIHDDESWSAMTSFFLPTAERLYVVFWSRSNNPDWAKIPAGKERELKRQWLELGGNEQSFQRWTQAHGQLFRTGVTYTEDGKTWAKPQSLLPDGWWLWRPQTFGGRHYLVAYYNHAQQWEMTDELKQMVRPSSQIDPDHPKSGHLVEYFQSACLFVSDDAMNWTKVSDIAVDDNDETGLGFRSDGRALVVSRIDASPDYAIGYVADPPYQQWKRFVLDEDIDQPAVLHHQGRWIVGGRYRDVKTWNRPNRFDPNRLEGRIGTRLWFFNDETGELTEGTTLPSWGDCGQPALVPMPSGDLMAAYYSCSQMIDANQAVGGGPFPGKYSPASIYVARIMMK